MNANTFAIDLRTDDDGHFDHLVIVGADIDGGDIILEVVPSEDQEPYDAALRAAGFGPVGNDQVRRA